MFWGGVGSWPPHTWLVGVKISIRLKEGNLPDLSMSKLHIFPLTLQIHSLMFSLKIYSHMGKNDDCTRIFGTVLITIIRDGKRPSCPTIVKSIMEQQAVKYYVDLRKEKGRFFCFVLMWKDFQITMKKKARYDVPGGRVDQNPPVNAGDTGSIPGAGRLHILRATKPMSCNC